MKENAKRAKVAQSAKAKASNKVAEKRQVTEQVTEQVTGFNFEILNGKFHKDILQIVLANIGNITNIVEHEYTKDNLGENFKNIKESGIAHETTRNKRLYITLKGAKKVTYSDSKTTFAARLKTLFK